MHFEDFTPYTYLREDENEDRGVVNVGWLDETHAFPQGDLDPWIADRLFEFCRIYINQARGAHTCQFCDVPSDLCRVARNGVQLDLGSAEIRVFGTDGRGYAAPNLIYHYVHCHRYLPPKSFLDALTNGPHPESPEYENRLQMIGHTTQTVATLYARDPYLAEWFVLCELASRTGNREMVVGAAKKLRWNDDKIARFLTEYHGPWNSA